MGNGGGVVDTLRIGVVGYGTVGRGVVNILQSQADLLAARTGVNLRLVRIATRTPGRDRGLPLAGVALTDDVQAVVQGPMWMWWWS